jgi:chromosome segregation ATPase
MFGRKNREIQQLHARVRKLAENADKVTTERDAARGTLELKVLGDADAWSAEAVDLASRLGRLVRGAARYRKQIAELLLTNANLRKQVDSLSQRIADITGPGLRDITPAKPTPELVRLTRELALANERAAALQAIVDRLQEANMAADRRPQPLAPVA